MSSFSLFLSPLSPSCIFSTPVSLHLLSSLHLCLPHHVYLLFLTDLTSVHSPLHTMQFCSHVTESHPRTLEVSCSCLNELNDGEVEKEASFCSSEACMFIFDCYNNTGHLMTPVYISFKTNCKNTLPQFAKGIFTLLFDLIIVPYKNPFHI